MKKGEHPPIGVKKLVIKLAGSNPRPTNRGIREAVYRRFETCISEHTISRYCTDAGMPTSSRSSRPQLVEGHSLGGEPHREKLFEFGGKLRDRLHIPLPDRLIRPNSQGFDYMMWKGKPSAQNEWSDREEADGEVEDNWGNLNGFDARTHPLYPLFEAHLMGSPYIPALQYFVKLFGVYVSESNEAYPKLVETVSSLLECPEQEDILTVAEALLLDLFYRVRDQDVFDISFDPLPVNNEWRLRLGSRGITSQSKQLLESIGSIYQKLTMEALEWDVIRGLGNARGDLGKAIDDLRASLTPDDRISKLLSQGRCELCP